MEKEEKSYNFSFVRCRIIIALNEFYYPFHIIRNLTNPFFPKEGEKTWKKQ